MWKQQTEGMVGPDLQLCVTARGVTELKDGWNVSMLGVLGKFLCVCSSLLIRVPLFKSLYSIWNVLLKHIWFVYRSN